MSCFVRPLGNLYLGRLGWASELPSPRQSTETKEEGDKAGLRVRDTEIEIGRERERKKEKAQQREGYSGRNSKPRTVTERPSDHKIEPEE